MTLQSALDIIKHHPDYKVLKRIPTTFNETHPTSSKIFNATIVDLETMGMNPTEHEIIEIALLTFAFSNDDGILHIVNSYNELNDPGKPIPSEITKITKITDDDVKGKLIDWECVSQILSNTHLVICHNSGFDRNFLELQTPSEIKNIVTNLPFGCTVKDINWRERGFESAKLDYLNWKLGFFYDGHRALNDCWATLNLFLNENGAFEELKNNVRSKQTLICAVNAPFDKKDLLKARQYRWSDGTGSIPKCWWICVSNDSLVNEKIWLDEVIYIRENSSNSLPQMEINSKKRYSFRAEILQN